MIKHSRRKRAIHKLFFRFVVTVETDLLSSQRFKQYQCKCQYLFTSIFLIIFIIFLNFSLFFAASLRFVLCTVRTSHGTSFYTELSSIYRFDAYLWFWMLTNQQKWSFHVNAYIDLPFQSRVELLNWAWNFMCILFVFCSVIFSFFSWT